MRPRAVALAVGVLVLLLAGGCGGSRLEKSSLAQFILPSKEIACVMDVVYVRCDVRAPTFTPPPQPADCDGKYGRSVRLMGERTTFVCVTDSILEGPELAFGKSITIAAYTCTSAEATAEPGVTCVADRTGARFTLTPSGYTFTPPSK